MRVALRGCDAIWEKLVLGGRGVRRGCSPLVLLFQNLNLLKLLR